MAQVQLRITVRKRWFFWPAFVVATILVRTGVLRDAPSTAHWDGKITAAERAAEWLANHAIVVEAA